MSGWLTAADEPVAMDATEGHDMSSMEGMMTAEQMDSMAALADQIITAQQAEITEMRALLQG